MRRLGEHMIEEVRILERQTRTASVKGDVGAMSALETLLQGLGIAIVTREHKIILERI
jgi:hypothetical protein